MKIEELITEDVRRCDLSYFTSRSFRNGLIFGLFKEKIESFLEKHPDAIIQVNDEIVGRNFTREQLLDFVLVFGGKWNKEPCMWADDKLEYSRKELILGEKITIRVSDAPPPYSCRIVEEEVDVPARREKRRRIVCDSNEDVVPMEKEVTNETHP